MILLDRVTKLPEGFKVANDIKAPPYVFQANKDRIKRGGEVTPGQVLVIPQ